MLHLEDVNTLSLGIHVNSTLGLFLGESEDGEHASLRLPVDAEELKDLTSKKDLLMRNVITR